VVVVLLAVTVVSVAVQVHIQVEPVTQQGEPLHLLVEAEMVDRTQVVVVVDLALPTEADMDQVVVV
jgi:hypothetical protein